MSKLILFKLLSDQQEAALDALKAAGHEAVAVAAVSVPQHVVAALKDSDIGKTVMADVSAISDKDLTGLQKGEQVLANTLPLIVKYAAGGGLTLVEKDVEGIGRELVQSVYNDFKATKIGTVVSDLAGLLGIK